LKRGEIWWADLGVYRPQEQTGRRPVIVWQSDTLTRLLQSVLVVPLTTNLDRAKLAGTALIAASDGALAVGAEVFNEQLDAMPKLKGHGRPTNGSRSNM
jgi:mRNA-degrading endonuclease toxin of MazEF toxin-antitoxin module